MWCAKTKSGQTIWSKNNGKHPRKTDSYQYRLCVGKALATHQAEQRPLTGLNMPTLSKMSCFLGREARAANVVQAQPHPQMFCFKGPGARRKCEMCREVCVAQGKPVIKLSCSTIQCATCGNGVCKDHAYTVCRNCSNKFILQGPDEAMQDQSVMNQSVLVSCTVIRI